MKIVEKIGESSISLGIFLQGLYDSCDDVKTQNNTKALLTLQGDNEIMPGITLRKDGRYMIRKMVDGIRKTLYATNYPDALKILKDFEKNRIKITKEKTQKQSILLKDWIEQWKEQYKKPFVSKKTFEGINTVCNIINRNFKNIKIKDLSTSEIQSFLNRLKANRQKEIVILYFNALLEKALNLELIKRNPFKAIVKDKKIKSKNNCFTYEEQEKILNCLNESNIKQDILIYLLTGCRPNEKPDSKNFDLTNNFIIINGTKTEKSKKRYIEISENFKHYLEPYVLTNNFHSYEYVKEEFKKICCNLKIDKPLLYRLRHTFATNHFILGTPVKYVADWLGHSSITLTLDTYTDIDRTSSKEKIRKLYNNFYFEPNTI